jgi:phenylalanyl-tRNA synthetase beta chain
MVVSYCWLSDLLPIHLSLNELCNILTSIGLEVESTEEIEQVRGSLNGLVIGEVLTCSKHPNADKLSVTTVDLGTGEPVQIVCGAPNVAAGQKVIVAPVGTTVYPTQGEPFLIKKAKIRGEESSGMICAEDEIGLGESHAGIMILPSTAVTGTTAKAYFNISEPDYAISIGLTPNRSDANSHVGVAKDVCAYLSYHRKEQFKVKFNVGIPDIAIRREIGIDAVLSNGIAQNFNVKISAPEACARYSGVLIEGVKIGPSPAWITEKLKTIGVRSINNIVDITNYILHETGQPLHAFDASKIEDGYIDVRFVEEGASFVGLDGKERKLRATDLMICSGSKPLAMGGVFGGLDSGVSDSTTNVFLESAYFNPAFIRKSSLHHGLRTDAATHFEKGTDINMVLPALYRAATLICQIAGGSIQTDLIDVYPTPIAQKTVAITYEFIKNLSGKDYPKKSVITILSALGFSIISETDHGFNVAVPTNKPDVLQPADIVEEIVRIDGLDQIDIPQRLNISLIPPQPSDRSLQEKMANVLCGMGLSETVTNSIVTGKFYPTHTGLVKMLNSLSSELDTMRPSMLESGLEVIRYNYNRKNSDLSLFEIGKVYRTENGTYKENTVAAIWATGTVAATNWTTTARNADISYIKGIIANVVAYFGLKNVTEAYDEASISWKWKNKVLASAYEVSADKLKEFDIKQPVVYAEIYWELWTEAANAAKIQYSEIPKYPSVERDLSLMVDNSVTYSQLEEATKQAKVEGLQSSVLFDVFENEKIGKGKKSFSVKYTFQLPDRTLTDAETEQQMAKLVQTYSQKLNAQVRQ